MRRRSLLAAMLAVSGAAVTTAACSSNTSPDQAGGSAPANPDTLVVYTNSNDNGRAEWVTQQAAAAGFPIQIVGAGGGDTTNKLLAEKDRPVADVVYGLNDMYFAQLKAAQVLDAYRPEWAAAIPKANLDADGIAWALVEQGIVLAYNTKLSNPPRDWLDLWKEPRFAKRYESQTGLGGATTQLIFAGILTRYRDDAGEQGVSQEGWDQIRGYFDQGEPAVEGKDLFARMAEGEVDLGQINTSNIPSKEKQFGVDVDFVRPEVGVPYAVEQIALVAGSGKADRAKQFIDWFGSAKTQAAFAGKFDAVPVHPDARSKAKPEALKLVKGLKRQEIDWPFCQRWMPEWIKTIELEYVR